MSGVDSKIVTMKFDNAQFQKGAADTMSTLDRLKAALHFPGASKGLADVSAAAGRVNLSSLEGGVTRISAGFLAMSTVAITALSNITSQAMATGTQLVKSLTIDPIKAGFAEYELKMGSIQTILANTARYGTKLSDVNKALEELNTYADKTIYNFGDMTKNIGLFTNAGIRLEDATAMIKGFSNAAAASGTTAEGAAHAAQQLSQGLTAGKITAQDWMSLTNAGMGNKNMQEGLINIAEAMDTFNGKGITATEAAKGFKGSLEKGWLTADVMSSYLRIMAGDMDAAAMASLGLSKTQVKTLVQQQKTAEEAATKVRTFTQLLGTMREAVGSGWSESFSLIFGGFNKATKLFTNVNNVLGGMIQASSDARNKILKDWKKAGGRVALIEGIKNAFYALLGIIKPIKEAFREIFPAMTGKQLADLTKGFRKFTEGLKIGSETAKNLKDTFKGVFAVFSIAKQIIGGVVGVIFDLIGAFGSGSGGILKMTGGIGNFVAGIDAALKKGDLLKNFFEKISDTLTPVVKTISGLSGALVALFAGGSSTVLDSLVDKFEAAGPIIEGVQAKIKSVVDFIKAQFSSLTSGFDLSNLFNFGSSDGVSGMKASLEGMPSILDRIKSAWDNVVNAFKSAANFLAPIWESIKSGFESIKSKISDVFSGVNVDMMDLLAVVNTGFFIAMYAMIRSFVKSLKGFTDSFKELNEKAGGVLDQVTANLKTMQTDIKANIILKIAGAIALLAAALFILSKIDAVGLGKSLAAVGVLLTMLAKTIKTLEKDANIKSSAGLALLAVGLLGLSVAVLAMSAAVAVLGNMDPATLTKGILAVGFILKALSVAVTNFNAAGGSAQLIGMAAGLLVLSGALFVFSKALNLYANLDTAMMAVGGAKIAAALLALSFVMGKMPPNMLASAAALIIVSAALLILSKALQDIAKLSGGDAVQAVLTLGGALAVIAAAMIFMQTALPGAAALIVVALALKILAQVLITLGTTPWKTIAMGLGMLVASMVVVGLAAAALGFAAPMIALFAASLLLLGGAFALIGGGMFLLATGLGILAASGAAGAAVLTGVIITIAELFPLIMQQFGLGIIAFAKVMSDGIPVLMAALGKALQALFDLIVKMAPKMRPPLNALMTAFFNALRDWYPKLLQAGIDILLSLLKGFKDNIGKIAKAAADAIGAWMDAVAKFYPDLADRGAKAMIKFLNGMADAINNNKDELNAAGRRLAGAILSGMTSGLTSGAGAVWDKAVSIARGIADKVKNVLGIKSPSKVFYDIGKFIDEGLADGLTGGLPDVDKSLNDITTRLADAVQKTGQTVEEAKQHLKTLGDAKNPNEKALARARQALKEANALHKDAIAAHAVLTKDMLAQQGQLRTLGAQYDDVTAKLKDAQKVLEDAKVAKDNASKSIKDQYTKLPEIDKDTKLATYEENLQKSIAATNTFKATLDQLRALGMDDTTYQKFLAEGVEVQPFLDELLASGASGVRELNVLNSQLSISATALGEKAATDLYQAGINAAQGLVDGLSAQLPAIEAQMATIANAMIKAIKKKLKIKSPSKEFATIGQYSSEGLAQGLLDYSKVVDAAAESVAMSAIDTVNGAIQKISDLGLAEMDIAPVIAPVLDLSQVRSEAAKISGLVGTKPIVAGVSFAQASDISTSQQMAKNAQSQVSTPTVEPKVVQFVQNNTSPKALTPAEIYRDTKSLLSLERKAL